VSDVAQRIAAFIRDNAFHATCAWSEEELKTYPLALESLKYLYGERGKKLPASMVVFQASLNMTAACKVVDDNTYVKLDINTFRLHDKITDICELLDGEDQREGGALSRKADKAIDECAELLLAAAMFRAGRYAGLPNLKINAGLRPLGSWAAAGYAMPGIVFTLGHEFTHRDIDRIGREILLGENSGNYDHILSVADMAIDVDPRSDFNRGRIIFRSFEADEISALQEAMIREIECDLVALASTYAALWRFEFNVVSILDSIAWTLGVELLLGMADALVQPSIANIILRQIGLRDMIMIAFAVDLLKGFIAPEKLVTFADACSRKLSLRKVTMLRLLHTMFRKRKELVKDPELRPLLSEIRLAGERLGHDHKTTRFMVIKLNQGDGAVAQQAAGVVMGHDDTVFPT
jgi:hypothetical protein